MKIGTRSVLFGTHCFFIHPWFVALAWWKLYGFPWDPRLWMAFFLHDIGYLGKPNMDGPEGEEHVLLGAKLMGAFGSQWHDFSLLHSRFYAAKLEKSVSKLCYADKLGFAITPGWLWLWQARISGEMDEYRGIHPHHCGENGDPSWKNDRLWTANAQNYVKRWVSEHRDREIPGVDDWTKREIKENRNGPERQN